MKESFFSETPLSRFVNRLGNLIILNLCYLLCCLPVITIGAANAALYGVCFRFGTEQESGPVKSFFKLFRSSLKTGTLLWLMILIMVGGLSSLSWLLYCSSGWGHYLFIPVLVLVAVTLMAAWYVFVGAGMFDNDCITTLSNGLLLSIGYLPQSLLILLINWLPVLLTVASPVMSLWLTWLWTFLYFSLAAWADTKIAKKAFAPYLPWENEENAKSITLK